MGVMDIIPGLLGWTEARRKFDMFRVENEYECLSLLRNHDQGFFNVLFCLDY